MLKMLLYQNYKYLKFQIENQIKLILINWCNNMIKYYNKDLIKVVKLKEINKINKIYQNN